LEANLYSKKMDKNNLTRNIQKVVKSDCQNFSDEPLFGGFGGRVGE